MENGACMVVVVEEEADEEKHNEEEEEDEAGAVLDEMLLSVLLDEADLLFAQQSPGQPLQRPCSYLQIWQQPQHVDRQKGRCNDCCYKNNTGPAPAKAVQSISIYVKRLNA